MSKKLSSDSKLQLIQSCRGIAALLVVMFHVTELSNEKFHSDFLFGAFGFGNSGVDFFFVLSGFIIFFVHRFDIGHKNKLKPFILKRFIRVYPLYWIVTLILLPVYFLIPSFGKGYERDIGVIVKSLILYPQEHLPILDVGWTLSHEIFFYLMFSLAIYLRPKFSKPIIFSWLSGTVLLFLVGYTSSFPLKHNLLLTFIFNYYNLEFALGCLAAYLVCMYELKQRNFLLITGALLFTLFGMVNNYKLMEFNDVFAYGIPSMLIVTGAASIDIDRKINSPTIFCQIGDASYSIYLVHYVSLSVIFKVALAINLVSLLGNFLSITLFVAVTIIFGCIIHSYLEKPLVRFFKKNLIEKILVFSK